MTTSKRFSAVLAGLAVFIALIANIFLNHQAIAAVPTSETAVFGPVVGVAQAGATPTSPSPSTPIASSAETATLTPTSTTTPTTTPRPTTTATYAPTPGSPTIQATSQPTESAGSSTQLPLNSTPSHTSPAPSDDGLVLPGLVVSGIALVLFAVILGLFAFYRRARKPAATLRPVEPEVPPVESQRPCPSCHTFNKPTAKFCKACGTALQPQLPAVGEMPSRGAPTRPLVFAAGLQIITESQVLPALPNGALIGDERYRVVKAVHQSKQLNRYVVEGSERVLLCPSCNTDNPDGSHFCQECATPLAGVQPTTLHYRLKEAASAERFRTEYTMAARGLAHSNIIPPRDAFDQKVNESSRSYVVLDDLSWETAAQAGALQELPLVLAWGIGLADGLAYLHAQRIVMGSLNGGEIALVQRVARWADFEKAGLVPVEEWQQNGTQLVAVDVRNLVQLLYYLITGLNQFDPGNRLLTPKANMLFAKALGDTGFLTAEELAAALRDVETDVRRPVGIDVHVARLSDLGKERDLDEDSILTLELGQVYRSLSTPLGVYAIADGMGGHDSGDVASRLAIQSIARRVVSDLLSAALDDNPPAVDYEAWIKKVVQDANQAVLARRKAAGNNMGTTLVMAVVVKNIAYLAHVGDSRAYLIRNAQIQLLTIDHSLVERLIATKQITREEAATHPQRNVIYKNIGDKAQVEPDISRQLLEPGDRLLLCCDGLSGEVSDADLLRIVLENPALPEACGQLIHAANEAGGRDNISVILIQVVATRKLL